MATTILNIDVEKRVKNLKKTAKKVNKQVLVTSEELVEGTLENSAKWQGVFAKAMKAGTTLLGKQQDLTFNTLEGVRDQLLKGGKRMRNLLEVDYVANKVISTVRNTTQVVEEKAKGAIGDLKETAINANAKAKKTIDEVMDTAVKSTNKATGKAKKTVAEVTAKVEQATFGKDDLKKVDGIGKKMEEILNEAGITTYEELASAKTTTLKEILASEGPRYKMHDPTNWGKQAKLAAVGKWDALKTLKAELKATK